MSSAAVQQSSLAQQQTYSNSSSSRDRFSPSTAASANPPAALSSSPPSRRPAARAEHGTLPDTPQQQPQYPISASLTSRGQPVSPTAGAMSSSTYNQFYPDQPAQQPSLPQTQLPIRTSAQQTPTQHASAASYDSRGYASRPSRSQGQAQAQPGYGGESSQEHRSPREEQPGSGRAQRTRNAPTSSRSATAIGQPPMGTDLPRENSAVINRIVVDDPQADLAREEARKAEGRPHGEMVQYGQESAEPPAPVQRSRQEHLKHSSSSRKEVKFGEYILGQTIGEGEFGKVKMGWKKDSTVQVAIKLIRKESLAGNTTRLPKIYREIAILRELQHPNIVRLHEFVETERHMGIILEYASGGELFDYILNHRYLKDPAARRLFAQLVSGVGYLHKKGIVHRDLKLENLLLDRNKHIIITDFGFANTFNPEDELGEEIENRISDKEFVKRQGLDKIIPHQGDRDGGHRRGDLMQTSCGSPCYAAPELVVSDGLYTGRKVDVWSCGVILYAMLAGYLPFDDDPANPEGDNINLLYKYIVSTPLTFPEYVTPHARDLLRRILVPDPRRRADLFEVARHSWLSEYTHVVGFIGSRVKGEPVNTFQDGDERQLQRSSSVREPTSRSPATDRISNQVPKHAPAASMGGDEASDFRNKQARDAKRRTVQVEYVAPQGSNIRRDRSPDAAAQPKPVPVSAGVAGRTKARAEPGPVEIPPARREESTMAPPTRPGQVKTASDSANAFGTSAGTATSRPNTSGTFGANNRLPSRGNSYSQPAAAQPTNTTAQGSFSQPKSGSGYIISSEQPSAVEASSRPASQQQPAGSQFQQGRQSSYQGKPPGHRRSSTLGSLADKVLNRSNSKRQSQQDAAALNNEKRDRRYPPVSMKNAIPTNDESGPRTSSDSRRPSFGFSRKASKERDSSVQGRRSSRRFSWLPGSMSLASFTGGPKRDPGYDSGDDGYRPPRDPYQQPPMSQQSQQSRIGSGGRPQSKGMAFGRGHSETPSGETTNSTIPLYYEEDREKVREQRRQQGRYDKPLPSSPGAGGSDSQHRPEPAKTGTSPGMQRKQFRDDGYGSNLLEAESRQQDPPERFFTPSQDPEIGGSSSAPRLDQYGPDSSGQWEPYGTSPRQTSLRPQQRRFGYDDHGHGGSSSATRRVMDFFRRRGKDREG
ncbi:hypothetical protein DOTSEDRAFT_51638 [Dothistroma septosporum NZE10]|uniref:Protein kinase domain-containing protein n=1 Tax=Dothistroma septosporum (strain NZE10 / CBS 128990) TaxID=675120 RepID=N1PRP3_DOTSN|nr:hypothetical protein DOTSEDRAFT_51638 [Dothistroma septosporum NZE10]